MIARILIFQVLNHRHSHKHTHIFKEKKTKKMGGKIVEICLYVKFLAYKVTERSKKAANIYKAKSGELVEKETNEKK